MDAWESLVAGSTIASGDAWEYLQAQGGGGTVSYVVLSDGLEIEMGTSELVVEIEQADVEAVVDHQDIEAEINQPVDIEITIDQSYKEVII